MYGHQVPAYGAVEMGWDLAECRFLKIGYPEYFLAAGGCILPDLIQYLLHGAAYRREAHLREQLLNFVAGLESIREGGKIVGDKLVSGVGWKSFGNAVYKVDSGIETPGFVVHLSGHTLRIVQVEHDVAIASHLLAGWNDRLAEGYNQEEKEQQARGEYQIVFEPPFGRSSFFNLFEKPGIGKVYACCTAKIKKVDDDRNRQHTQRP